MGGGCGGGKEIRKSSNITKSNFTQVQFLIQKCGNSHKKRKTEPFVLNRRKNSPIQNASSEV
ncbi:hypothetical protein DLM77_03605 [Leptospira yasudae]|uniref:Uncharacterized protein n=1 Tax=Leptospira yasudae TaxID=2202201 RepID=A0ABX9M5N7_9LEPT|nr:hypothetical protein DLM77_03605 [Leptospira yasudae]